MSKNKILSALEKYELYVKNIQWHINTNKPDGEGFRKCEQRIKDYNEVISDLKSLAASTPVNSPDDPLDYHGINYVGPSPVIEDKQEWYKKISDKQFIRSFLIADERIIRTEMQEQCCLLIQRFLKKCYE